MVRLTGGSIILVEGDELVLRAAAGPFAAQALGQRLPRGRGRLWQVIDRGEPFQSADLIAEGHRPTTPVRSYLAVPLLRPSGPFGILEIDSTEPHAFEAVDSDLMQRVAGVLGGSLELALRYAAEAQAKADAEAARRAERAAREATERAADRIARLQAITAALSEAVTPEQVAEVIIGHALRGLGAAAAGLSLLTADGSALELIRASGYPEETIRRWRRYAAHQYGGIADALRTGQVVWHASLDELHRAYPEHEPLPEPVGRGGRAAVPLMLGDRALGVLYANFREPRTFGADDREFMLTFGRLCAQALERARLYEHEHHIAESLQQAFLPTGMPQLPGVGVHALYVPGAVEAAIGGDWYDVFDLPDGKVAFSIGDVAGRGLSAAVVMGQVRQTIRVLATEGHDPATVIARAGRTLAAIYRGEKMATAVFGVLDLVSLSFTYACAGHPAPLLATPDGRAETLLSSGVPLGIDDASARQCWTVGLPRGSLLVLYTDGLIEATRDVAAGHAALAAAARRVLAEPPVDPARVLREQVLGGRHLPDDVAVVTVSVAPVPLERLEMSVPADPSSLASVRRSFRRLARDIGLPDDRAFDVQVALGEALNNAIEHAYGAGAGMIEIRGWRDGRFLVIEIEDHGRWRPERVEGRGHGLLIMRSLADAVDLVRDLSRTVVRLQAVLPGQSDAAPAPLHARGISRQSRERGEDIAVHTGDHPGSFTPPAMDRRFRIGLADDVPVVRVTGDVDLASAARFEAALEQAARADRHAVIVDLSEASYFDSQGAHVLFRFGRRLAVNRQRLLLVAPAGPGLRSILAMTGLAESFPVLGSAEEAVVAAKRGG